MDSIRWHDPYHDRDFNERTNRDQVNYFRDECEVLRTNNNILTARVAELEAALREYVYQTTHLSPLEDDGSHWCKISAKCLEAARAALAQGQEQMEFKF